MCVHGYNEQPGEKMKRVLHMTYIQGHQNPCTHQARLSHLTHAVACCDELGLRVSCSVCQLFPGFDLAWHVLLSGYAC